MPEARFWSASTAQVAHPEVRRNQIRTRSWIWTQRKLLSGPDGLALISKTSQAGRGNEVAMPHCSFLKEPPPDGSILLQFILLEN